VSVKTLYVKGVRQLRAVVDAVGIREPAPGARGARAHLRSLLDVHDVDALIRWDMPWWTYSAVDAVDAFLARRPAARVFEYGSGASTVWLARRAGEVHSVEHDRRWAALLRPRLATFSNVTLHEVEAVPSSTPLAPSGRRGNQHLDFTDYVSTIDRVGGRFDLVVIDGRARTSCLAAAVKLTDPHGLVVVDNSRRRRYQAALSAEPFTLRRHRGAAPGLPYPEETALLWPVPVQSFPPSRTSAEARPDECGRPPRSTSEQPRP
jgi:hypothetical protein